MRQKSNSPEQENMQGEQLNSLQLNISCKEKYFCNIEESPYNRPISGENNYDRYPGYEITNIEWSNNDCISRIYIYLSEKFRSIEIQCPECKHKFMPCKIRGYTNSTVVDAPDGHIQRFCKIKSRRYECPECGRTFILKNDFVLDRVRITTYAYMFIKKEKEFYATSNTSLELKTGISRETIRQIDNALLSHENTQPCIEGDVYLSCDEHSIKRGHSYVSIVAQIPKDEGFPSIAYMSLGRKSADVQPLYDHIKDNNLSDKIIAVSQDFSAAYMSVAKSNLQDTPILGDHFHAIKRFKDVIKHGINRTNKILRNTLELNDAVLQNSKRKIRSREELLKKYLSEEEITKIKNNASTKESEQYKNRIKTLSENNSKIIKGYKWIETHFVCEEFRDIIESTPLLLEIAKLKDEFNSLWSSNLSEDEANKKIDILIEKTKSVNLKTADSFAKFIEKHRYSFINVGKHKVTNATIEGINTECKLLQRTIRGIKDVKKYISTVFRFFRCRYLTKKYFKNKKQEESHLENNLCLNFMAASN